MKQFVLMTDLDGTLIRGLQSVISQDVASILAPLAERRHLIINSARHPEAVRNALGGRLPFVPTIALNGAALCDENWAQPSQVYTFVPETVEIVLRVAAVHDLTLSIYSAKSWWVTRFDTFVEHEIAVTGMKPIIAGEVLFANVLKITAMGNEATLKGFENSIAENSINLSLARSNPRYCEISPEKTNKSGSVTPLLNSLGMSRNLVDLHFFGDSYNDIECAAYSDCAYTFNTAPAELRCLASRAFPVETDKDLVSALNIILRTTKL